MVSMLIGLILIVIIVASIISTLVEITTQGTNKAIRQGLLSSLISIILFIGLIFWGSQVKEVMQYKYSYDIYAITDLATTKGSRYYIEQDFKYYHLANYKDGKKMYCISREESYIVEDKNAKPHIEVFESKYVTRNIFEKIIFFGNPHTKEYKIVVPSKTLTDEFNIDMNN